MNKPTVFVSSSTDGLFVAREIARQLESAASTTVWSEGAFHPGKTVTESLTEAADRADFAVFVLTTDDTVGSRQSFAWPARPNVIFEIGFLAGRIGLSRTFSSSQTLRKLNCHRIWRASCTYHYPQHWDLILAQRSRQRQLQSGK